MEEQNRTPVSAGNRNNDTMAWVAYITIIGFIVAIVSTNDGQRSELVKFHLRQALGLFLTGFAFSIIGVIPILGWAIAAVGGILVLIMLIMGLISAANKEMKPVPILGEKYKEWFANTFN